MLTDKQPLIAQLDTLRAALKQEPETPLVTQALHQCERLDLAINQYHAEGLRFAAFTLHHLVQQPGTNMRESTLEAARKLKEGLDAAGFGTQH
ncbi:MAG: hypothetical protein EXQ55_07710 [Acidobacteria bacterium]|nr:hypothetical protein [Acidobacteriota bacterium]